MKIDLQPPFNSKWEYGYLEFSSDGRRQLKLRGFNGERSSTTYARYLMGVKLGYEVPDHLEVDHKDNDKTNDDINNLQLLTPEENKLKEHYRYIMFEQVRYGFYCAWCNNSFILTENEVNKRMNTGVEMALCSKRCSSSHQYYNSNNSGIRNKISEDLIKNIKQLNSSGLSGRQIADKLKINRDTVYKYLAI